MGIIQPSEDGLGNTGRIPTQGDRWDAPDATPDRVTPRAALLYIEENFIGGHGFRVQYQDVKVAVVLGSRVHFRFRDDFTLAGHLASILSLRLRNTEVIPGRITYTWAGNLNGVPIHVTTSKLIVVTTLDAA